MTRDEIAAERARLIEKAEEIRLSVKVAFEEGGVTTDDFQRAVTAQMDNNMKIAAMDAAIAVFSS